jgi:hypothetical protein
LFLKKNWADHAKIFRVNKKVVPFDFALELLSPVHPQVKPMFGCYGVYVREKIVFMLREKEHETIDNGVWLATTSEYHQSLKKLFPSMRSIGVFGGGETGWQLLPADQDDFEESVTRACELVMKNDPRIGKIPKSKKKR